MRLKRVLRTIGLILLVLLLIFFIVPLIIPLPTVGADPSQLADDDGRFIIVDGLETYIRESGEPAGEPIILLHGWGASTVSWNATIPALAEAGYRVIAFDRPPYGLSAKVGDDLPLSITDQAHFTIALMDALNIEQAALIGHSMGGGVIAYAAVLYPERINRLVFVDGAVRVVENDAIGAQGSPFLSSLVNFYAVEWWARLGMRAFLRPDSFAGFQRTAYYDQAAVSAETIANYGRALQVEDWDQAILDVFFRDPSQDTPLTGDQLRAVTIPSLIMWGENDSWVPPGIGVTLHDLLPVNTYITYPQVGHLPMEEVPAQFNADLLTFLESTAQMPQ